MYYYLQEGTNNWSARQQQEKLRKLVGSYGIAGETVTPSPARTIDELVGVGLEKNYSTFAAVGSDLFLNKVASSLINQRERFGTERVVLGLVPTDLNGEISRWLGLRSVEDAALALKARKVISVDLPVIEPSKYFIVPLKIQASKPFSIKLETSGYTIDAQTTGLQIDRDLNVKIAGRPGPGQLIEKIKHFFTGAPIASPADSQIRTSELKIVTLDSIPVYLMSEMIAKTPVSLKIVPQVLQLVATRGSIS